MAFQRRARSRRLGGEDKFAAFLPRVRRLRRFLKIKVDAGELGIKSGKGFHDYPEPAFQQPDFVAGTEG